MSSPSASAGSFFFRGRFFPGRSRSPANHVRLLPHRGGCFGGPAFAGEPVVFFAGTGTTASGFAAAAGAGRGTFLVRPFPFTEAGSSATSRDRSRQRRRLRRPWQEEAGREQGGSAGSVPAPARLWLRLVCRFVRGCVPQPVLWPIPREKRLLPAPFPPAPLLFLLIGSGSAVVARIRGHFRMLRAAAGSGAPSPLHGCFFRCTAPSGPV